MIVDADVDYNGGGIRLHKYNNLFMRECVLSGKIVAFVHPITLET